LHDWLTWAEATCLILLKRWVMHHPQEFLSVLRSSQQNLSRLFCYGC